MRFRSLCVPSCTPTSRSFRYSFAHAASPASTAWSNEKSFLATPPVDVIVTTMTSVGCSTSTSMCRTDAVPRPGADTSASRRVTRESISVVDCSASSSSLRIAERSSGNLAGRASTRASTSWAYTW